MTEGILCRRVAITQRQRVFDFISDWKWYTLAEISHATGSPEASVSACLRDFRKQRHGGHTVNKRWQGVKEFRVWEYQLICKI